MDHHSPPKRKRGQSHHMAAASPSSTAETPTHSPSKINTSFTKDEMLGPESVNSPRTKVAYHFTGLQLSSPVKKLDLNIHGDSPLSPSDEIRKRVKVLEPDSSFEEEEIPESPQAPGFKINFGPERTLDPFIEQSADGLTLRNQIDPVIRSAQNNLIIDSIKQNDLPKIKKPHSSVNRMTADSKSRSKKRAGTPPLKFNSKTPTEEGSPVVTTFLEIDQAALTWHDDEITGHLAEDPDDDGRGVNGIGFKPTAAEAYQRVERRKQQMADYKAREAREARAKRGARRRGSASDITVTPKEKADTARRVRFQDGDAVVVHVT